MLNTMNKICGFKLYVNISTADKTYVVTYATMTLNKFALTESSMHTRSMYDTAFSQGPFANKTSIKLLPQIGNGNIFALIQSCAIISSPLN